MLFQQPLLENGLLPFFLDLLVGLFRAEVRLVVLFVYNLLLESLLPVLLDLFGKVRQVLDIVLLDQALVTSCQHVLLLLRHLEQVLLFKPEILDLLAVISESVVG